jgi:hypothetical protein
MALHLTKLISARLLQGPMISFVSLNFTFFENIDFFDYVKNFIILLE